VDYITEVLSPIIWDISPGLGECLNEETLDPDLEFIKRLYLNSSTSPSLFAIGQRNIDWGFVTILRLISVLIIHGDGLEELETRADPWKPYW